MNLDKYIGTKQQNKDNLENAASSSIASTSATEPSTQLQDITEMRMEELFNENKILSDLTHISELPHNRNNLLSFPKIINAPLGLGPNNLSDVGTWPAIPNSKTII